MKILPFKIPKSATDTLIVQEDRGRFLYDKFHQHEELQLSIIIAGEGSLIVGDRIIDYKADDILVFGSHVPHVLKSTPSSGKSHMISLFFTKDSFGHSFFELPEFDELSVFLKNSVYGLRVLSRVEELRTYFVELTQITDRLERFIVFMRMLKVLRGASIETIATFATKKAYSDHEGKRMARILEIVMNQYQRDFSLKEVANLANMSPNAFCRYFKQRTNKTFFQFLIEVRIENACRLLSKEIDMTISDVCFNSGFKNLSNFNRKFKDIKGMTPSDFKNKLYNPHFV